MEYTGDGTLSGEQVRQVRFGKPPFGHRGYDDTEVDAFLARAAAALDGDGQLSPEEVHSVVFRKPPIGGRGYPEPAVDAFLDRIVAELRRRNRGW